MYFSGIELGEHFYWNIGTLFPKVQGEVLLILWFISTLAITFLTTSNIAFSVRRTLGKELFLT